MGDAGASRARGRGLRWPLGLAASLVGLGSGCWVPNETGEAMLRDIRALKEDMQAAHKGLAEQRAQLGEQMERAAKQIKAVDQKLKDLNRAARMTDADFGVQLEELRREVQELRGQIELLNYQLGQLEPKIEGEGSLLERIEGVEKKLQEKDDAPPAPKPALPEGAPKDKKGLLAHGKKLIKEKKIDDARGVYREVIRQWPNEMGTTDQAYFQLGETYFGEKKFRSGLQEYIQVLEKFPTSSLAGDAYFRIGLCSMNLGNYEDAQIFFSEILKSHKKPYLVKAAKAKLKEVNRKLDAERRKRR